ncbi:MAG: Gfo/Idh/MocA family oxidoreductase [Candidatus Daviesbacteria bacterium]|nr:Gfo/Idh/MocA family oxidoreductase [Candidatus Daviesbacteria bacterium]
MPSYSLGLIGFGNIGKIHYDALTKSGQKDFQVKAIADLSTQSVREVLTNPNIQAVSINTPPNTHHQLVMDALRGGKHVLVEKPPALTVAQCEEMSVFANQQERVLFMSFHARYNPAVEAAKEELVDKNIEGIDIQYSEYAPNYHATPGWIFNPEIAGGGVLIDSGINALSVVTYVLPDWTSFSVKDAKFKKAEGFKVETEAHVRFSYGKGSGTLSMDWMNKGPEVRQVTFTADGDTYVVDIVKNIFSKNGEVQMTEDGSREIVDQQSEYKQSLILRIKQSHVPSGTWQSLNSSLSSEYRGVYRDFARHLAQGKSLISTKELALIQEAYRRGNI